MGFMSFAGRVLFAAAFLLSAYQEFSEFGVDGGPAAKALSPKFNTYVENVSSRTGIVVPHIEKHVITATIALKGLGGVLFILSSSLGAVLLHFIKFAQNWAHLGALLFFLGMKLHS